MEAFQPLPSPTQDTFSVVDTPNLGVIAYPNRVWRFQTESKLLRRILVGSLDHLFRTTIIHRQQYSRPPPNPDEVRWPQVLGVVPHWLRTMRQLRTTTCRTRIQRFTPLCRCTAMIMLDTSCVSAKAILFPWAVVAANSIVHVGPMMNIVFVPEKSRLTA